MSKTPIAVIIGGGPAGLTAAYELQRRTSVKPIILEADRILGGISRTEEVEGNRIDIGGHRFFSKSDVVMQWWLDILPLERGQENAFQIHYQGQERKLTGNPAGPDPAETDEVMLVRSRSSRIYWNRQLLDYPLKLSVDTIKKIGLPTMAQAGLSYARAMALPRKSEQSLEDFLVNRFGYRLYDMFFKSYTEKVWGVPCREIAADWGAQRIKGLDIGKIIQHALKRNRRDDVSQKGVETSLIERFLYPKLGPGQMWETVGRKVLEGGGEIHRHQEVIGLKVEGERVTHVESKDRQTGETRLWAADHFISTMPIRELCSSLQTELPQEVKEVAAGLVYRDFFTVGLLVDKLALRERDGSPLKDNWCYVQEPSVLLGRIQLFNNWSPYLVQDPKKTWLGLEYFCFETDEIWSRPDQDLIALGTEEMARIGFIDPRDVRLGKVLRVKKTYPAYFGTYSRFNVVRDYLDRLSNLYCVGRNGQHRYNNQDHSMLTAMNAVEAIKTGSADKSAIWNVNVEQDYHEEK